MQTFPLPFLAELIFTFTTSSKANKQNRTWRPGFTESEMPLSQETVLQTHPWNVAVHYAWLGNTGVLKRARDRGGGKKCLHTPWSAASTWSQMLPVLAWRKLFKPEGLLGYFGCGREGRPACLGVCVCVSKERWGVSPRCLLHTEPVQHNTPPQRALTPDLRSLHSYRTKTTRRREAVAASHTSKSLTSFPPAPSHSHLCGGKSQPGIQWGGTYDCNRRKEGAAGRRGGRTIFTIRCANEREGTMKGVTCACNTF